MSQVESQITKFFINSVTGKTQTEQLLEKLSGTEKQAVPDISEVLAKAEAAIAQAVKVKHKLHLVCNICNLPSTYTGEEHGCNYPEVRDENTKKIIEGDAAIIAYVRSKD